MDNDKMRAAFDDANLGYEFPSTALREGALNSFAEGWRAALAQSPKAQPVTTGEPVARIHIRDTENHLKADIEVPDGGFLPPEHSPVDVCLHPAAQPVLTDAQIMWVWSEAIKIRSLSIPAIRAIIASTSAQIPVQHPSITLNGHPIQSSKGSDLGSVAYQSKGQRKPGSVR